MANTATYQCKECGTPFEARTADRARGWARYCSKFCKARKQTRTASRRSTKRHDGLSPMKFKFCEACGDNAVNGIHGIGGRIEWYCANHMAEFSAHPFSDEAIQP